MEKLFDKEVKVIEAQFNELMRLLEGNTWFKWLGGDQPTEYIPDSLTEKGSVYIQFWANNILSFYDKSDKYFKTISYKETKQILTGNQPKD